MSEMKQRLESRADAARRARSEFDSYGDTTLLTELEAAAVTGFSHHTLKFWRLAGAAKGPTPVYLHGMVRYAAGEIRRWRACEERAMNDGPHTLKPKAREIETAL
jgi:predicted DNA-binding transcriptional regulator AlpA